MSVMHPRPNGGIEGLNADEQLLANISRHWFGLVLIYLQVIIGIIAGGALIFLLLSGVMGDNLSQQADTLIMAGVVMALAVAILILLVATQIYRQNKLIISDKNITQVLQRGLFSRQVSELSMANVEDVTADQQGILAHIFGYGTLKIETAGEQNNFNFIYCPNPDYYGKAILDARQQFLHITAAMPPTIPAVQPPVAVPVDPNTPPATTPPPQAPIPPQQPPQA